MSRRRDLESRVEDLGDRVRHYADDAGDTATELDVAIITPERDTVDTMRAEDPERRRVFQFELLG